MSGKRFIKAEGPLICATCGQRDELRPYGKNGELICFECGMKDIETTEKKMREFIFGDKP